ncbi:MAG: exodeoxyribonuclease VII small subunit [Candidatus Phosphoribacter sp.]|nr:exodeoxyribonuclease VII small subunit [Actinomycetales bacterium]
MSSTSPQPLADIADLTYEQARDELIGIVARLEAGQVPLQESMTMWQRGEALAAHCSDVLDGAQATIDEAADAGVVLRVRDDADS